MRHAVLVFGSEPARRRAAELIAGQLEVECHQLGTGTVEAWEAVVDRLAADRHVVVCATSGEPTAGDAVLPIVRSAVRLTGGTLCAVWALGANDASIEGWAKRMHRGSDRLLAIAPALPDGVEFVPQAAVAELFGHEDPAPLRRRNGTAKRNGRPPAGVEAPLTEEYAGVSPLPETRRPAPDVEPSRGLSMLDWALLEQLRELPRTRAMHAFVLSVLCDSGSETGATLRENVVAALAHAIVDDDVRNTWSIVPRTVCDRLSPGNEAAAVVAIAKALAPHPLGEAVSAYIDDVAASFESIASLSPATAAHRIFAPSETLDTSFDRWFRNLVHP